VAEKAEAAKMGIKRIAKLKSFMSTSLIEEGFWGER
jgi:hypothetical protein